MVYDCGCDIFGRARHLMTSTEMRFFWLPLSMMKCIGVPFTHISEWKRCSPSSGLSGSPGWSLVVETMALGSNSMIILPLSGSGSTQSHILHLIQRLSLWPPMTALSGSQHCYAKGSYGSHTTSRYLSLSFRCPSLFTAWTGFPNIVHL
jgi:hypothetical protein